MTPRPRTPDDLTEARRRRFAALAAEAARCRACPRMADQPAVLSHRNGSLRARLVFVAEAPGRLGSGRTGVPFYGDRSGENFQALIDHIGLDRSEIFITNAVLCNPLSQGRNSRPTVREIRNCGTFLERVLALIQPELVVTLGGVGLDALNRLLGTGYRLATVAGRLLDTVAGRLLDTGRFQWLPLYHPSPRVTRTRRSLARQKRDFQLILKALSRTA